MLLRFITKKRKNGTHDYLIINTDKKQYANFPKEVYSLPDECFILIPVRTMRELKRECDIEGYITVWSL